MCCFIEACIKLPEKERPSMVERVSTGIPGLDKVLEGGFPENSVTLVTGGPGAGKTTFCVQFIHEGLENEENCLYLSTGQSSEEIRRDAKEFGIDFDNYIEHLSMANVNPSQEIESAITDHVGDREFDRIVLDSISVFEMYWGENGKIRKYMNRLVQHLKNLDATVVITSERPDSESDKMTRFGVAEFLVDGVIKLEGFGIGDSTYRSLQAVKMRRTGIDGQPKGITIDDEGLSLEEDKSI